MVMATATPQEQAALREIAMMRAQLMAQGMSQEQADQYIFSGQAFPLAGGYQLANQAQQAAATAASYNLGRGQLAQNQQQYGYELMNDPYNVVAANQFYVDQGGSPFGTDPLLANVPQQDVGKKYQQFVDDLLFPSASSAGGGAGTNATPGAAAPAPSQSSPSDNVQRVMRDAPTDSRGPEGYAEDLVRWDLGYKVPPSPDVPTVGAYRSYDIQPETSGPTAPQPSPARMQAGAPAPVTPANQRYRAAPANFSFSRPRQQQATQQPQAQRTGFAGSPAQQAATRGIAAQMPGGAMNFRAGAQRGIPGFSSLSAREYAMNPNQQQLLGLWQSTGRFPDAAAAYDQFQRIYGTPGSVFGGIQR